MGYKLEMMPWRPLLILSSFLFLQALSAEAESDGREAKQFFVSTTTLTSIVTTTNQCYKALSSKDTAMMTCKKRKKRILRSITDQAVVNKDSPIFPTPSSKEREPKKLNSADLAASYADARAARFVYYWATFTETSTSFPTPPPPVSPHCSVHLQVTLWCPVL